MNYSKEINFPLLMDVEMRVRVLRTFRTNLLVHMHQKKRIGTALQTAAKIASLSGPLRFI
jgi:hypothetical protein